MRYNRNGEIGSETMIGIIIAIVVILVGLSFTMWSTVGSGSVGVFTSFGKVEEINLSEGFHFKAPWHSMNIIDCRVEIVSIDAQSASMDMQDVHIGVTVNYYAKPTQGWRILRYLGSTPEQWKKVVLAPAINESIKAVAAQYTAADLVQKRAEVRDKAEEILVHKVNAITESKITGADSADKELFFITQVSIDELKFSKAYTQAIEEKQVAEQATQREKNELEREKINQQKQVAVAESRKMAESQNAEALRIKAQAESDADRIRAEGRAQAYKLELDARMEVLNKLKELGISPSFYEWVQRWDGVLPRIMGEGNSTLLIPDGLDKPKK